MRKNAWRVKRGAWRVIRGSCRASLLREHGGGRDGKLPPLTREARWLVREACWRRGETRLAEREQHSTEGVIISVKQGSDNPCAFFRSRKNGSRFHAISAEDHQALLQQ